MATMVPNNPRDELPASLNLLDLPPEMKQSIIELLEAPDIRALRHTCTDMAEQCLRSMKSIYTRLYLQPSRLQDVAAFCDTAVKLRDSITDIVILGDSKVTDRQKPQLWPHCSPAVTTKPGMPSDGKQKCSDERPLQRPISQQHSVEYPGQGIVQSNASLFEVAYAGLLRALRNLNSVRSLTYISVAPRKKYSKDHVPPLRPGYFGKALADKLHDIAGDTYADNQTTITSVCQTCNAFAEEWADRDLFLGILGSQCLPFEKIDLKYGLLELPVPDQGYFVNLPVSLNTERLQRSGDSRPSFFSRVCSTIKSAVIPPRNDAPWDAYIVALFGAMSALENVEITRRHVMLAEHEESDEYARLLQNCHHIRTLNVWSPGILENHSMGEYAADPLDADDIIALLRNNKDSLRVVTFNSVTFSAQAKPRIEEVVRFMKQELTGLEKARMVVPCIRRCPEPCGCGADTESGTCELYPMIPSSEGWCGPAYFDKLATMLSVKECERRWDFGEWVMRPPH